MPGGESFIEVSSLDWCEGETDVLGLFEDGVEVVELPAECLKMFIKGGVGVGAEHIVPDEAEVEAVEDEAAKKAVLGIGDEVEDLSRRTGEERREARIIYVHVFSILASDVGYGLVVECLAEAVGVVAVVGAEGVGDGVSFGLEHKACAAVVIENLIDCGGGGVGRNEEHTHRRFFGLFHIDFLLAGGIVFSKLVFVFEENREFPSQLWRECREREVFVNIDNIVRMRSIDSLRRLRAVIVSFMFRLSILRNQRIEFCGCLSISLAKKNHFSLDSYPMSMYIFAGK